MASPVIVLHSTVKLYDRPVRQIDLAEHKLQHLMLDSGVIVINDLDGNRVLSLSPSQWSHIVHPAPKAESAQ
jgi:hypothetical protein